MKFAGNDKATFTIVYEFSAPKKLVFEAFSKAEALGQWWGPVECQNTVMSLDFRMGGTFHYKMEKDGHVNYGRFLFGNIVPHDMLEFSNAFSDDKGNIIRAPFEIALPLEIFYRLTFFESNGKTIITMTGTPIEASPEDLKGFLSINPDMRRGFGETFQKLSDYLRTLNNISIK